MKYIINILKDLGYKKVSIILDGDKPEEKEELEMTYNEYRFFFIPADDIRDKKEYKTIAKAGIVNSKGKIKNEYKNEMKTLINQINEL